MWENIDITRQRSGDYSVMQLADKSLGMKSLRVMFPNGAANELNFVLFSTSGVHGTYNTIECAEKFLNGDGRESGEVCFIIIQPRLVSLRYGVCYPLNQADIDFLKSLRHSSRQAFLEIGG